MDFQDLELAKKMKDRWKSRNVWLAFMPAMAITPIAALPFAWEKPGIIVLLAAISTLAAVLNFWGEWQMSKDYSRYHELLKVFLLNKRFRTAAGAVGVVIEVNQSGRATIAFESGVQETYCHTHLEPMSV